MIKNNHQAILLIDFDNTIVDSSYPAINGLKPDAKKYINLLHSEEFYIIVNTCRTGKWQDEVKDFLNKEEVIFDQINENHPDLVTFYGEDSRKLSGCIHIDDKNLECLVNPDFLKWENIYINVHTVVRKQSFKSSFHYIK